MACNLNILIYVYFFGMQFGCAGWNNNFLFFIQFAKSRCETLFYLNPMIVNTVFNEPTFTIYCVTIFCYTVYYYKLYCV
jgi:hypothetical protein